MSHTTLELRGRDLIIVPASEYDSLTLQEVLNRLFGKHLPASVRSNIVLDRRQRFLRIQPIHFSAIKRALRFPLPLLSMSDPRSLSPQPWRWSHGPINWKRWEAG
jgi:hypothetical protein